MRDGRVWKLQQLRAILGSTHFNQRDLRLGLGSARSPFALRLNYLLLHTVPLRASAGNLPTVP